MKSRVALVVEPDRSIQQYLGVVLGDSGYEVTFAESLEDAVTALAQRECLFTLLDSSMLDDDGADFARRLEAQDGDPGPIIVLSNGRDGAQAMRTGSLPADGWVQKPVIPEELDDAIKNALSHPRRLWRRGIHDDPAVRLWQEIALWRSPKMRAVWEIIRQAAGVDVTVLVCGETGTGKEVVARAIHQLSSRRGRPFVKVNCAAVPRELLETELFGHERGAFTGAHQLKIGKFESANHGTVFLDEIGDLHPALQAKLLHVLQDGTFSRVGGKVTMKVDVRVLAATNQDLERAVMEGRFREDLYYRLNVVQIVVPPLRERPEEIPLLADYFVERYARLFKRHGYALDREARDRLSRHRYPGNVRELENMIKRMIVLGDPFLCQTPLPSDGAGRREPSPGAAEPAGVSLKDIARRAARAAEREAIARVLGQTGWNRVRAAKLLKISYRALLYKIKDVGLDRQAGDASGAEPRYVAYERGLGRQPLPPLPAERR